MTEQEWLAGTDPAAMLAWLTQARYDDLTFPATPPTGRKLRLACEAAWMAERDRKEPITYRGFLKELEDLDIELLAYQALHRFGLLADRGRGATGAALLRCLFGNPWRPASWPCPVAGFDSVRRDHPVVQITRAIYAERRWGDLPVLWDALSEAGCPAEVECLECGGSRFRHDGTRGGQRSLVPCQCVRGCVPNPLLAHLCGPGPHARGCHVVDLILGKE